MKNGAFVPGGSFMVARAVFQSAIWTKPPQYLKLFLWLIGRAAFQDGHVFKGHTLKRGQLVTSYSKISEALAYHANHRIIKPSLKEIRLILDWLASESMIFCEPLISGTWPNQGRPQGRPKAGTGAYLGLLISVINFDSYQDLESYKGRPQAGTGAEALPELGQTPYKRRMIEKNVSRERRKPLTLPPENFPITEPMRSYAKKKGYTGDLQTLSEKFLNHHRSKGNRFSDWNAAFRNWILKEIEFNPPSAADAPLNGGRTLEDILS